MTSADPSTLGQATDAEGHRRTLTYEPSLDGLRAFAIVVVVLYHACSAAGYGDWFRGGFLGVSVFFTLSGFLITSLLLAEHERTGRVAVDRFWVRRIRRLVPALLTVVAAVVALSALDVLAARRTDAAAAIWSFTNWHVIIGGEEKLLQTIVGPLGPTWSLAVEEQVYLLLVGAVLLTLRSARPHRSLLVVALVAVIVSIGSANLVSDWQPRLEYGTDTRAAEVAVGVGLAVVWRSRPSWRWSPRMGDLVATIGLTGLVLLVTFADFDPPWLLRGGFTIVAVLSALTITGLLAHGRAERLLATRVLVYVGTLSYSWYLVHWPVILTLNGPRLGIGGWRLVGVQVAVGLACAAVLHHVVEDPIRHGRSTLRPTLAAYLGSSLALTAIAVAVLD